MGVHLGDNLISGSTKGVINQPVYVYPTVSYVITQPWANVTGHSVTLSEAGTYRVVFQGVARARDTNANVATIYLQLHNGAAEISGTRRQIKLATAGVASIYADIPYSIEKIITVTTATTISLQATKDTDDESCNIWYAAGAIEPYCMYQKLGLEDASLLVNTKWQKKVLSATLSASATDIASLRFSNLEIGKTYKLSMNAYHRILGTNASEESRLTAKHNGSIILYAEYRDDDKDSSEGRSVQHTKTIFTAAATTVTFDYYENGICELQGIQNAYTYAILEELPNHEEVSIW